MGSAVVIFPGNNRSGLVFHSIVVIDFSSRHCRLDAAASSTSPILHVTQLVGELVNQGVARGANARDILISSEVLKSIHSSKARRLTELLFH